MGPPAVAKTRGAQHLGELDRGGADAAGAAMDQHALAADQPAALEDIVPDGEIGFRQRRGLDQVEALGHRQAQCGRRDRVIGIAAAGDQRADLVADGQVADAAAARDDLAGHFEAGNVGRARGGG